ncbi:YajG family lipoprotein [Halomonas shantousis]
MHKRWNSGLGTLLLAVLMLVLAGCAQSPQVLRVSPKVSGNFLHAGQGQEVTVTAVDGRTSDVLGTRSGSAASTATISVSPHDVVPKLQEQAEIALRSMGFVPTQQAGNHPSLTLTLQQLQYTRGNADKPLLDAAHLQAVIEARAVNGRNTYTGTYTAKRDQSYAIKPDWETNNRMVSDLLSDALNRVFSDPEIARTLER